MSKRLALIITVVLLMTTILSSCAQQSGATNGQRTATVTRGTLNDTISSDGNLEMPNVAYLKFGTPGMVKFIYVSKGDYVKAGTLLCKMDDTRQLLSVEAAQYSLEIAINNVVQTLCGLGYPTYYTMATALMRFGQAQAEIHDAGTLLQKYQYEDAASNISLARYDLIAARTVYADPKHDTLETQNLVINQDTSQLPDYSPVISTIDIQINNLGDLQKLIEAGDYAAASQSIDNLIVSLDEAHTTVKSYNRLPDAFTLPDTSTALAISGQVLDSLSQIQKTLKQDNYDVVDVSQKLQMAQHDLMMSNMVLNERETIYRAGLSPQTLRTYNLNIDTALVNLEKAKQDVLDTEIYAPFDGVIVDVPIKINDRFSQFDYAAKTSVLLVDTKTIRITGTVDELDIPKVRVKQPVTVYVDAFPNKTWAAHVTFISPFAAIKSDSDVVKFPVEIYLDAGEDYSVLRSGLTATAEIVTSLRENVLYIPNSAVKGVPGDYYAEVVDPSTAKITKRPITIGLQNKQFTEIFTGLKEGETVLSEAVN